MILYNARFPPKNKLALKASKVFLKIYYNFEISSGDKPVRSEISEIE